MPALRPRVSILLTLSSLACAAMAADLPPGAKKAGYTVSAEGGIEGKQVYRYDAEGNPLDGAPPLIRGSSASTPSAGPVRPAAPAPARSAPAAEADRMSTRLNSSHSSVSRMPSSA